MGASPPERELFGARVAAFRDQRGLKQREVADELGRRGHAVTDRAVSGWERGMFAPSRSVVQALDELLQADGEILDALGFSAAEAGLEERVAQLEAELAEVREQLSDDRIETRMRQVFRDEIAALSQRRADDHEAWVQSLDHAPTTTDLERRAQGPDSHT